MKNYSNIRVKFESTLFSQVDHGKARKTAGSVRIKEEEGRKPKSKTKKVEDILSWIKKCNFLDMSQYLDLIAKKEAKHKDKAGQRFVLDFLPE